MKKLYQLILGFATVFSFSAFLAATPANGQLNVTILRGTTPVTEIEECQGQSVALTVKVTGGSGTGRTYVWTGDVNPAYFNDAEEVVSFKSTTPPGVYVATVTVEDDGGFTGSSTITVTIKSSPLATIAANGVTTFCFGNTVELEETNAQVGVTYNWQRNFINIDGASNETYNAPLTGEYRVEVTNTVSGCSKFSNKIFVTVHALPEPVASNTGPYCHNDNIVLTSTPNGMVDYAWTTNAVTPFTSGLQDVTILNATANNSGTYTITVEDGNGCINSAQTTVLVYNDISGGTVGTNHAICYNGDPNNLASSAPATGGDGVFVYLWQISTDNATWNDILGATELDYNPDAGLTQTTYYRRRATTGCGVIYSNTITVTVYAEVLGGTIGSNQNICYNTVPAAFTNSVSPSGGTGVWVYEWEYQPDGSAIWTAIASTNSLTYAHSTALTEITKFRRKATNDCATTYSNEITVNPYSAINGGVIAESQSICYSGDPAAFTDATSPSGGTGAWTYVWESRVGAGAWSAIPATNSLTYDIPAGLTTTTDYRRSATNSCGTGYSNILTVTVYPVLAGGTVGANHSICYNGDPNNLASSAPATGGDGVFVYLWQSSTDNATWNDILGATELDYNPDAGLTQTTYYRRRATASCGVVYSNTITVTVYAEVLGGTIGSNQNICYNTVPAGFTNSVSPSGGTGVWVYEWEYQPDGSGTWTAIASTNSLTYTHPTALVITTKFRRKATNTCATVYSNEITINVFTGVDGGVISESQGICYAGDPAAFTNTTSPSGGTGAWSYVWESRVGAGAWGAIPATNSLTYDIPSGLTTTTDYRRASTNACGTGYSNTITVTVYADVVGGTIGTNHSICYNGDPNNLASSAPATGGDGVFAYLWQSSTDNATWNDILSATALDYNPDAGLTQTTYYRRRATTGCGVVYSNTITVTVYAEVLGGTIGSNQNICYNTVPAAFTNSVSPSGGTGVWVYEWEYQPDGSTIWTAIASTNSLTYTPSTGLQVTTKYRRKATNTCATVYSNEITINVWPEFNAGSISIASSEVCYNNSPGSFANAVSPTGGSGVTTFAWDQKVGAGAWTAIPLETGNTYAVPALTQTTSYRRFATNSCGSGYSNEITITVNALPTAFNVTGSGNYCQGSAGLEVGLSGSQINVTYTLYKNSIATATTALGTGSNITFGFQLAGTYTVEAKNNITNCSNTMNLSAVITEVPVITGNAILDNQLICSGSAPAQFTGANPGGGTGAYTYQWYKSTDGSSFTPILGATALNYSEIALTQTTWYRRNVLSGACSSESNVILVTVNQPISNNTIGTAQTICYSTAPAALTGSIPTGGNGAYTYQWQMSTVGLAGPYGNILTATNQNYQPGVLTQTTWYRRVVTSAPCSDNTSASVQITVSPEFQLTGFTKVNPECNGSTTGEAEVNHTGGIAPYNYSWSPTAQTSKRATGLSADVLYTVTVTDFNGCAPAGGNTVTLTQPAAITIDPANVVVTNVTGCFGNTNGSIVVTASGGTPNYTYQLYNGASLLSTQFPAHPIAATFSSLAAGSNYRIVATDSKSCPQGELANIAVTQPSQVVIDDVATTPITCNGSNDGTITITASGGTAPYTYSIDGPSPGGTFQASNVFTVGEGNYDIYVKDSNGCEVGWPTQVQFTNPSAVSFSYNIDPITSCNGALEGRITITGASGGTGAGYQYSIYEPAVWSGTTTYNNLPGGNTNPYYIRVKDSNNCTITANNGNPVYINQPTAITYNITNVTNITGCWYNTNGSFRVQNVLGGIGSKQVSINGTNWFNPPQNFTGLAVNTYTVTVRDANGCTEVKTVTLTGPAAVTINSQVVTNNICFGQSNGSINVSASGGTGNLNYSLYLNAALVAGPQVNNGLFTLLANGDYELRITDDGGCTLTNNISITSPATITIQTELFNYSCAGVGNDGAIHATGTGGTAPYTVKLYKGGVFQSQFTNVAENTKVQFTALAAANNYRVDFEDAQGCAPVSTGLLAITEPVPLTVNNPTVTNPSCFGLKGTVAVTTSGGSAPMTFRLYNGANTLISTLNHNSQVEFTNVDKGTGYYVTVEDACELKTTLTFNVVEPAAMLSSIAVTDATGCFGVASNGIINITASSLNGPMQYSIDDGANYVLTNVFNGLSPNSYSVRITDGTCTETGVATVGGPTEITHTTTLTQVESPQGSGNGRITISASGGTGALSYTLTESTLGVIATNASGDFSGINNGNYQVTITDTENCTKTTAPIFLYPALNVTTQSVSACNGLNGSITVDITDGQLPFTVQVRKQPENTLVFNQVVNNFGEVDVDGLVASDYSVSVVDGALQTYTGNITVGSGVLTASVASIIDACEGNDGSVTFSIVGTAPFTITWNGGTATGTKAPNLVAGRYNFTIVDANNCQVLVEDVQVKGLTLNLFVTHATCWTSNDGQILASAGGFTGQEWYRLSRNGSVVVNWTNIPLFEKLIPGNYTVTVAASGCNVSKTVVLEPSPITVTLSHIAPTCTVPGSITATATGGTAPLEYTLYDAETWIETNATGIFTITMGGIYRVDVDDANSCGPVSSNVLNIPNPTDLSLNDVVVSDVVNCSNLSSGEIEIIATGSETPLQYSIDNISWQLGSKFTGLPIGSYTIWVKDNMGCSRTRNVQILDRTGITISALGIDPTASQADDGKIEVTIISGGTQPFTYTLLEFGFPFDGPYNAVESEYTFQNLPSGTYRVRVEDVYGCTALSNPITISYLDVDVVVSHVTCLGANNGQIQVIINDGAMPLSRSVINIATGLPIPDPYTNLLAGWYRVKVTDGAGKIFEGDYEVKSDFLTATAIVSVPLSCIGKSDAAVTVEVTGGKSPFTYSWNTTPVKTTQTVTGLPIGIYTVTVTDVLGCITTSSIEVVNPNPIIIAFDKITDAKCNLGTGSFEVIASQGTAPYTYTVEDSGGNIIETKTGNADQWVEFSTNLLAGTYTIHVDDAFLCRVSDNVIIGQPTPVTVSITQFTNPSCDVDGNGVPGEITAVASGGTPGYTYSLFKENVYVTENSSGEFKDLDFGDYYVEVVDANACGPIKSSNQILARATNLSIDNLLISHVLCNGLSTGSIEVVIGSPTGVVQYTIADDNSGWQLSNKFIDLPAGNYTVRVKDDTNCIVTRSITINEPTLLVVSSVVTKPTTALVSDGSIDVSVTGGVPNYWYKLYKEDTSSNWNLVNQFDDTGLTTHTFTNIGVGSYRIDVEDNNGCITQDFVTVIQFTVVLTSTDLNCHNICDGTITLVELGGPSATKVWKDGNDQDITAEMEGKYDAQEGKYMNLCIGTYKLTATNAEGVISTANVTISQPTAIVVSYVVSNPLCYTLADVGKVTFTITGGTPFIDGYDIVWDNGTERGFEVDNLPAGTYNFTIKDQNGCEYPVEEIEIVYPVPITISTLIPSNLLCFNDNSGMINVWATGATPTLTFRIDGAAGFNQENVTGIFDKLAAGTYDLTITDENGCLHIFTDPAESQITLTQPTAITITSSIAEITEPLQCHYSILPEVRITLTGGTPNYTHLWSNGQQTLDLLNVTPGTYLLTITDHNGCKETETVEVPGPKPFNVTFAYDTADCQVVIAEYGTIKGAIRISNITGGNGTFNLVGNNDFHIKWYRGDNDQQLTGYQDRWALTARQAGDFYAVLTDAKTCTETLNFTIPYNEKNMFTVSVNSEPSICYNTKGSLWAIKEGDGITPQVHFWYNLTDAPTVRIYGNENFTTPNLIKNTNFRVDVISDKGCMASAEKLVNVYAQIKPFIDRSSHSFYLESDLTTFKVDPADPVSPGDSTVISVLIDTEFPFEVLTKNPDYTLTYSWTPVEFFNPADAKSSIMLFQTGIFEPFQSGTILNTVTLKNEKYVPLKGLVQSEFGCVEEINLKARVLDRIKNSNVFSPNDDGKNDIWKVPYSDVFPDLEIKIFNRWGAEVWAASGTTASMGWNGKTLGGRTLPFGTYYYVIKFNVEGSTKWKPISGSVTIVK